MSVKCEEPSLVNVPSSNLNYWTVFVSRTELRTDKQTDRQTNERTDRQTIRLQDAPGGPFRPGHKIQPVIFKIHFVILKMHIFNNCIKSQFKIWENQILF